MTSATDAVNTRPSKIAKRTRGRPVRGESLGNEALLRAARRTFARHGFSATSIRGIAREAGVNVTLVTHYFGSKEALWRATVEQIAEGSQRTADELTQLCAQDGQPREHLEAALLLMVNRGMAEPDIGLFVSTAVVEEGERLEFLIDRLYRPYRDVLVPLFEKAMRAGEMKLNDPEVVFWLLLTGIGRVTAYPHIVCSFSPDGKTKSGYKEAALSGLRSILS